MPKRKPDSPIEEAMEKVLRHHDGHVGKALADARAWLGGQKAKDAELEA